MDVRQLRDQFGSYAAIAAACGISKQAVIKWKRIPAEHCRHLEVAAGGAVTRYQLRPDVFGPSPEAS